MLATAVLLLAMQARVADPVRSAEAAEMLLRTKNVSQAQRPHLTTEAQDRNFEEKFNAVVSAMEAFSKKYKGGSEQVWPAREAEALRKALTELQKLPALQNQKVAAR